MAVDAGLEWKVEQTENVAHEGSRGNNEVPEDNGGAESPENGFSRPKELQKNAAPKKIRLTKVRFLAVLPCE
jgi:hypothetical protein